MTSMAPSAALTQMLGGFQISQALYVIAKLDVATVLDDADGPLSVGDVALRCGAQERPLARLLRTVASLGVLDEDDGRFRLADLGRLLSRRSPESLRDLALMWMETHYLPFSELVHTVVTGESAATHFYGKPFFDWMAEDQDRSSLFSSAMASVTGGLRINTFADYSLPDGMVVADVGGADGSVLVELIGKDLGRRGIILDIPSATPIARVNMAAHGLANRVDVIDGDFFDRVPRADVYVLSYILHDWDDAAARRILDNVARAGGPGSRVAIIETVVPDGNQPHLAKMIDLTMLGMLTGQERSEAEYRQLCSSAGIRLDQVVPTASPFSVIEATVV